MATPYPDKLRSTYGHTVVNAGSRGLDTDSGTDFWDNHLIYEVEYFDILVLMLGINDIRNTSDSAATIFARLEGIADDAISRGKSVVLCTPIPAKGDIYTTWDAADQTKLEAYNGLIAAKDGVTVLDTYADFQDDGADDEIMETDYDSGDHVHPNQTGADRLAELIDGVL